MMGKLKLKLHLQLQLQLHLSDNAGADLFRTAFPLCNELHHDRAHNSKLSTAFYGLRWSFLHHFEVFLNMAAQWNSQRLL
jgi:hypothetical protein